MKTKPTAELEKDLSEDLSLERETSDIFPTVFGRTVDIGSARWTFARGEDSDAPEVTCILATSDEELAEALSQSSRSEGHGLRSPVSAEKTEEIDNPSVVVTLYL